MYGSRHAELINGSATWHRQNADQTVKLICSRHKNQLILQINYLSVEGWSTFLRIIFLLSAFFLLACVSDRWKFMWYSHASRVWHLRKLNVFYQEFQHQWLWMWIDALHFSTQLSRQIKSEQRLEPTTKTRTRIHFPISTAISPLWRCVSHTFGVQWC